MELLIQLISDWHLIIVFIVLLILFPIIFYLSALDKTPVRVKKVPLQKKKKKKQQEAPRKGGVENFEDTDEK